MNKNEIIISLKNVSKEFGSDFNKVEALKNISLEIEKSSKIALIGPSGSGKTTLLNLIGLLDIPTTGEILINNEKVNNLSQKERTLYRRKNIGFVFQDDALIEDLTVFENVELPLVLNNINLNRREKVMELLTELGLSRKYKKFPNQLSGGEKQRVSIARAVIGNPLIILADEPTANLDNLNAEIVLKTLENLTEKFQITLTLSTHDEFVYKKFKRIIKLNDGKKEIGL